VHESDSGNRRAQLAARSLCSPDSQPASLGTGAEGRRHLTGLQEEFEKASGKVSEAQGAV